MGLKLSQLPDGESIFLDANIFLYSAFDHPTFGGACRDFLARVDQEEVHGYCSAFVLNEVFHKLMMSEIVDKFGVQAGSANNLFKKRPEIICELCDVWDEMDIIDNINNKYYNFGWADFSGVRGSIKEISFISDGFRSSCNNETKPIDQSGNQRRKF